MAHSKTYMRALRQAKLAAELQTDPQYSALRLLLRQANQQYATGVRQARGGAAMLRAAAHAEAPKIGGYFNTATGAIGRNLAATHVDTSNPVVAADVADTLNRLASTRASAQGEARQRGLDAVAGANYQVQNLGAQRRADVQKVGQQLLDLAGQKGKVQQSTLLTLLDQAAGRSVTRRGQNLSHQDRVSSEKLRRQAQHETARHNRATERNSRSGRGGKGRNPSVGLGSLTPYQESGIRDRIQSIVSVIKSAPAKDDNGKPLTDHALRQHLLNGTSPLKKPISKDLVNIAFDLARLGYLSVPNMRAAHERGLHIPRSWLAKRIPGVTPGVAGPPPPGL